MKDQIILLATDFSDNARNAADYGIKLFGVQHRYILMHAFGDDLDRSRSIKDLRGPIKEGSLAYLEEQKEELITKNPGTIIECVADPGHAVETIIQLSEQYGADFVIMGSTGRDAIESTIMGSTTYNVAKQLAIPLIAVPQHASWKQLKRVVLAADYQRINDDLALQPVLDLCEHHNAKILLLNVIGDSETRLSPDEAAEALKLNRYFEGLDHSFHEVENNEPSKGIEDFISDRNIEMLIMLSRKGSIFHRIQEPSVTKRVLLHTQKPILVLQDSV